jgi:hypothetical protein
MECLMRMATSSMGLGSINARSHRRSDSKNSGLHIEQLIPLQIIVERKKGDRSGFLGYSLIRKGNECPLKE